MLFLLDASLVANALFCACDIRHRAPLQQQKVPQEPQRRLDVKQRQIWEGRLAAGMADSQQDSLTPTFAQQMAIHLSPPTCPSKPLGDLLFALGLRWEERAGH